MDIRGFSSEMKDVVEEARLLVLGNKSSRVYKYDRVILFAKIWFLQVEIYVNSSSSPFASFLKHLTKHLQRDSSFLQSSGNEGEILDLLHGMLKFLSQSADLGRNMFRGLLYKFLVQMRLLKAQVLLLELMKLDDVRLNLPLKIQIGTLREGLIFLSKSDINQKFENSEKEKLFLEDFQQLAGEVESLCNSHPAMEGMLPDLLLKVKNLKSELKRLYFDQIPTLCPPEIIGLGCIEAVLQKMEQLQSFDLESHDSVACAIYQIKAVREDLESIVPWYTSRLENDLENADDITSWLVDVVYQVEHVIDSIMLGRDPLWKLLLWLYHLSEVIHQLKLQIEVYESGNQAFVIQRTQMVNDPLTEGLSINVEASYEELPNNLKQCLLYFGNFPRDEDISVRTLTWLWVAERLIPQSSSECLEDVAERYLMNLISRSLVIPVKRGYNGKVKTCQVHGVVLDFCLSKAEDVKFLRRVTGASNALEEMNYEDYRLSIHGDPRQFIASKPSGSSVRSLQFFVSNEMYPGCHNDLSFIAAKMKLLKVLNSESLNIGNTLEDEVGLLICLRYMAIGGDIDSLPSSLSELKDLEILAVKGLRNHFVLPSTIWSMTRLRHILVTDCIFTLQLQNHHKEERNFLKLDGLKSLSMPSFRYGKETNDILAKVPSLHRLKCILLQPQLGEAELFPDFGCLHHLEILKISYSGRPLNNVEWSLPLNLKELTLSNFCLPWDQIFTISKLPNLEFLKLMSKAFEGTMWEMEEGDFKKLRCLKLDSLNVVRWSANKELLPSLEHLVMRNCKHLKEFPPGFKDNASLQRIDVHQCGVSVEVSVRSIAEAKLDYGNENFISNIS